MIFNDSILKNKKIIYIVLAVLSIMAAVSVVKGCMNAYVYSQDFQWDAAKALSLRIDPYDESLNPTGALDTGTLGDFYDYFKSIDAPQKMEANQFPSLLMLLYPMTLLPPSAARVAWLILNLVFTAAIIWLLRLTFLKELDRYVFAAVSLLMLAGTPYRNQLGVGQHTLFAFAFFLLAVYLSEVKNLRTASSLALFISYFKYTLTAPLVLYFVYKRKIKEIIISVGLHLILTVCSALWLGESVIDMIKKPLKVASALSSEGGIDLGAVFSGSGISFMLAGLIALMLFVMALMAPKGCDNLIFAVSLLWSLILTYHRTYDFFTLSAVVSLFAECDAYLKRDDKKTGALEIYYVLLTLFIFFVLRIFSENIPSRCVAGILYYGFTVIVTYILFKNIKDEKNGKRREA